jgi:hydroxymethylpyrimidine pyrophosphatase-like HAD family hydrolase
MSDISLVISDVDRTFVTSDKILSDRSRSAVLQPGAAGIGFSIVGSRPPFRLRMLVEPFGLQLPMGTYSGGALVMPDLAAIGGIQSP